MTPVVTCCACQEVIDSSNKVEIDEHNIHERCQVLFHQKRQELPCNHATFSESPRIQLITDPQLDDDQISEASSEGEVSARCDRVLERATCGLAFVAVIVAGLFFISKVDLGGSYGESYGELTF